MNRGPVFPRAAVWLLALAMGLGTYSPALAQPAGGSITGKVTTPGGQPVADAQVRLVELNRRATVDGEGSFRFDNVPAGSYLLEASSSRLGNATRRVRLAAGGTAEVTLAVDLARYSDEIVVTASPDPRSQEEVAVATTVVNEDQLQQQLQPTLGETLSKEAGVSSTFFGPGASQPIIRGLGGDRIRVLESGVGTGDASTTSPDHAVSLDPISAERIEIVRGPATLLYGSSAEGGVVNVIDNRIPNYVPQEKITGTLNLRGGGNANERAGNLSLDGGAGSIAWHLEGLKRETDDYDSGEGRVVNSAIDSDGGSAGFSWVGNKGYLGVSGTRFDTTYGNPAEEEVKIDMRQRRWDVQGEMTQPFAAFRSLKLRFGHTDYEHVELEGGEVGTRFLNDSWEGRVEALQRAYGPLSGSFGVQLGKRDFSAIGEESFVPFTTTDSRAFFTFQEITQGALRYQLGLRYENQTVDADVDEGVNSRDLSGVSGSLGLVWLPGEDYGLSVSVSRSVKLPNANELFANGPHIATQTFEIGDPNLDKETNVGAEVSLRKRSGRLTGEINLFANRYDGFIFEQFTGEVEGGEEGEEPLNVVRFAQRDAEFRGAELKGVLELLHTEPHHLNAEFGADFVRAELRDTGEPLPRIPPRRYRLGLHYRGDRFSGLVEGIRAERQDRIAGNETETPGYTFLNANFGYRLFAGNMVYDLLLRGNNLTDELAFNHVSFLKDVAPLPGRDVSLALRVSF
ncbi:MAG TPA: TonB-dependent receptor [Thermoanaerobaculia bacterium]|nr:TonB-dependent receptor [Thermoanaerobaculia bacterium]